MNAYASKSGGSGRQLLGLRRGQGLAPVTASGGGGGSLHGGAIDAATRPERRGGVSRSKPQSATRTPLVPLDRVNRPFTADRPNTLWVADFTYVSTGQGFVYVAFVIDVFARSIVGWKVARSARTNFVLDTLEQDLRARQPFHPDRLIHPR